MQLRLACLLCNEPEILSLARATGAQLAHELGGPSGATLNVSDIHPGDTLSSDGLPAPTTGTAVLLESGSHHVQIVRKSDSRSQTVDLASEERRVLTFEEMPQTESPPDGRRAGAILGGLGLAVASVGASFLVFDDGCASTTVDGSRNCSQVHDLAVPGWAMLATGATALVTGLVISISSVVRKRKREAEPRGEGVTR